MKIVVVGLGKIGESIIRSVAPESHDIVAIDVDGEVINAAIEKYDISGVVGNGARYEIQEEAGVNQADLFIAVTQTDELNIMACVLAKNVGAKLTIARVRNPDYSDQMAMFQKKLGIDVILNPEYEAAKDVKRVITLPNALRVEPFADGRFDLAYIVIEEKSRLIGLTLAEIGNLIGARILVGAVIRGDDIIIPSGDFFFQVGDRAYLVARPDELSLFFKELGLIRESIRNIMLIGGGKISYYLAKLCEKDKEYNVKIFENDPAVCASLNERLTKTTIVYGDGTDQEVLTSEGFGEADAAIALTGNDEENLVLSFYATKIGIPKVFAKVNRESLVGLLGRKTPISVISPRSLVANQIVSVIRSRSNVKGSNVLTVYKLENDRLEALEFVAKSNFKQLGREIKDMKLKKGILLVGIVRRGKAIVPGGFDKIMLNDRVLVITKDPQFDDLNNILDE